MELAFEVDKITESIENARTGEVLTSLVMPLIEGDLKGISKKNGWLFDWRLEFSQNERQVFKLITEKEPEIIHGLVSLEKEQEFIFIRLIESSPFNLGIGKKYLGVSGNLVAYACKLSKEYGFDGVVSFEPKTALISHYEKTLGAVLISARRMAVLEESAKVLIDKYFPETKEKL